MNIKNSATCFRYLEPPLEQIQKHSTGTTSECAHYGIPYCLQNYIDTKFPIKYLQFVAFPLDVT
jgi:hypothetical protein